MSLTMSAQRPLVLLAAMSLAFGISACTEKKPVEISDIDQSTLCEVHTWAPVTGEKACKPGQKIVFLPDSWGNDQLPVIFAALNCDLRYQVALTHGAVTCIFRPQAPQTDKEAKTKPSESGKPTKE